jgi:protein TonB
VDAYKSDVAEQIVRYNPENTFHGKLPPMLPAIVVVSITVDHTGKMTKVAVQRSRDNSASKVALASVRRAGVLPRPFNLAAGPGRSLTFSETFLFNADYHFQLRTLAPVQTAD